MDPIFYLLAAVVAGWILQSFLTFRQSMAFNSSVHALRSTGSTSVGVGGKRYRGGRAFVAIAVDDHNIVRGAITLRGLTTFARARPLPGLVGFKVNQVAGDREIPQLSRAQRAAAQQAATLWKQGSSTVSTRSGSATV